MTMAELTCMSFVPKGQRGKLRHVLMTEDTGELRWRERKTLFGSEFYFSGPAGLVMRTHRYVSHWVAENKLRRQAVPLR
jgi:hypothetical protein